MTFACQRLTDDRHLQVWTRSSRRCRRRSRSCRTICSIHSHWETREAFLAHHLTQRPADPRNAPRKRNVIRKYAGVSCLYTSDKKSKKHRAADRNGGPKHSLWLGGASPIGPNKSQVDFWWDKLAPETSGSLFSITTGFPCVPRVCSMCQHICAHKSVNVNLVECVTCKNGQGEVPPYKDRPF